MKEYDYLIVGAGLWGAVFAHEMTKAGKKCLVIDKRSHAGGNTYCEFTEGIHVHSYGPHIFHTNDQGIWDYVRLFVEFNNYVHTPLANANGKFFNLPFNMNTFYQLWGTSTPEQARKKIADQTADFISRKITNLEDQALCLVGKDIYETLIRDYTRKQWGRHPKHLPASIIKRIPLRFTFNNNYFQDKYQGIPIGGYNRLTNGLLAKTPVRLNTDYFKDRSYWDSLASKIVFTGQIDAFFEFHFGNLEYRSLKFVSKLIDTPNYQGVSIINYTDPVSEYTRIVEHKHFEFGNQKQTIITYEYPIEWTAGKEPYYPINDHKNTTRFKAYRKLAENTPNVIFGGRLAEYQYYDMHQVIASALKRSKCELP
ncbi:UDP-galactopyranose mutase [Dyadobacter sp. SG02]|uniref:UDP-galactopyranose mutase n=1 Tax=Dyadobacter sp. SG02 TaxID=1855291 RepID=UPI0008D1534C|nr:UDP-galactopyranose mutase [Dyadobacter sp. SG02]SEJ75895.1 UDP-galactopyranose mutase [Dyadobacter sp. SG02]